MSRDGVLTRIGNRCAIRFERDYARPIEKVWAAITTPERLAAWLAHVTFEPRVGAPLTMTFDDPPYHMQGKVTAWDPPRLFAFNWPDPEAPDSEVRFELTPLDNGCRLLLSQSALPVRQIPSVGAGWHEHLDRFEIALDGVSTTRWDKERERELEARYRAVL